MNLDWMEKRQNVFYDLLAVWMAFCAPEMISLIGPNEVESDGAGSENDGAGNENGLPIGTGTGNDLNGTATGTGKMIGDFFKFFKMVAAFDSLANLATLSALTAANFNAIVLFAARNGAVIALNAAIFVALA